MISTKEIVEKYTTKERIITFDRILQRTESFDKLIKGLLNEICCKQNILYKLTDQIRNKNYAKEEENNIINGFYTLANDLGVMDEGILSFNVTKLDNVMIALVNEKEHKVERLYNLLEDLKKHNQNCDIPKLNKTTEIIYILSDSLRIPRKATREKIKDILYYNENKIHKH